MVLDQEGKNIKLDKGECPYRWGVFSHAPVMAFLSLGNTMCHFK